MKDDHWFTCENCDAEYKIVTTLSLISAEYCPFCSAPSYIDDEDVEDDE